MPSREFNSSVMQPEELPREGGLTTWDVRYPPVGGKSMPQMTSIAAIEKPSTPTPYFSLNSSITQIITDWRTPRNSAEAVSYTHLRAHETPEHLVCRLLLEKKK